ncbi:hypothetical protein D3C75_1177740 [compost metagenome]
MDIYLVEGDSPNQLRSGGYGSPAAGRGDSGTAGSAAGAGAAKTAAPQPSAPARKVFLTGVTVNYVRTEDNNDVQDSENGNTNNRFTSTGKVAAPELKLKKSDGELLGQYLEQGKKLWIVRVE